MEGRTRVDRALLGRALCVFGLVLAVVGAYFVSVAIEAMGIVLGVVGYYLGARALASVTILLCAAALFVGLLVGQGFILGPYDGGAELVVGNFSNPAVHERLDR